MGEVDKFLFATPTNAVTRESSVCLAESGGRMRADERLRPFVVRSAGAMEPRPAPRALGF